MGCGQSSSRPVDDAEIVLNKYTDFVVKLTCVGALRKVYALYQKAQDGSSSKTSKCDSTGIASVFGLKKDVYLERLMQIWDEDRDGMCDFREFLLGLGMFGRASASAKETVVQLRFCYRLLDLNQDGAVSVDEMIEAIEASETMFAGSADWQAKTGDKFWGDKKALDASPLQTYIKPLRDELRERSINVISFEEFSRIAGKYPRVVSPQLYMWNSISPHAPSAMAVIDELRSRRIHELLPLKERLAGEKRLKDKELSRSMSTKNGGDDNQPRFARSNTMDRTRAGRRSASLHDSEDLGKPSRVPLSRDRDNSTDPGPGGPRLGRTESHRAREGDEWSKPVSHERKVAFNGDDGGAGGTGAGAGGVKRPDNSREGLDNAHPLAPGGGGRDSLTGREGLEADVRRRERRSTDEKRYSESIGDDSPYFPPVSRASDSLQSADIGHHTSSGPRGHGDGTPDRHPRDSLGTPDRHPRDSLGAGAGAGDPPTRRTRMGRGLRAAASAARSSFTKLSTSFTKPPKSQNYVDGSPNDFDSPDNGGRAPARDGPYNRSQSHQPVRGSTGAGAPRRRTSGTPDWMNRAKSSFAVVKGRVVGGGGGGGGQRSIAGVGSKSQNRRGR